MLSMAKYTHTPENLEDIKCICRDFKYFSAYTVYFTDPYYQVYFVVRDGIKVGFIVLSRHSYNFYCDLLWVDEDFRRAGVGKFLLERALQMASGEGYRSLVVDSNSANTEAHRFYEHMEAHKFGEYINLYGVNKEIIYQFRLIFPANLEKNLK